MTLLAVTVFWASLVLLVYSQFGYPVLIAAAARLRHRPWRTGRRPPAVSVVVVAHDEGSRIDGRLQNLLSLDYPPDCLEVIVASDGSADDTAARARRYPGVEVREFPGRRGKPSVLNDVVPTCRGEIVVLADARQRFGVSALRALTAPFADPSVGAVTGVLLVETADEGAAGAGVGLYWRIETNVRKSESQIDSVVGATGAIYAIRRRLFAPIPADTILDDVLIPLRITRRGYRVVLAPEAHAFDRSASSDAAEFRRKVRTIAGNFQLFARERWLLSPWANRLWVQTISHKLLRLSIPALLIAAFAANVALAVRGEGLYIACLLGQVSFYVMALLGHRFGTVSVAGKPLAGAYAICLLAGATVVGLVRFVAGTQSATWDRVEQSRSA